MSVSFCVRSTSHFERDARKRVKRNHTLLKILNEVVIILSEDPKNISGKYDIKKLRGTKVGEGQWRIRIGDYRIRYDVFDRELDIVLYSFRNRKEGY